MAGRFSIETIFRAVDRMSEPVRRMQQNMARFTSSAANGLGTLDRASGKVHSTLRNVALATGVVATAAALAAGHVAGAGMDFEQAITNVGAVSLLTREQIGDLEQEALRLGASTKFTAAEAANGMELMAKAGFDNAQIIQGIGGVLSAAAAEGAELAETAGHVSNVLKGMGLATSEATRVADVLTLASARTNSSISSLGESMANVSSTARQFNIPLEDTVAAVALLQDVGLDASVAGSALNTMLTQLANPTDEIVAKMRDFGVTFQDARGNMLPLQEVMENMALAAKKSGGNMDQVAFFADLVGLRGQKAAANLKDLFVSGKFQELAAELSRAAGSAKSMAAIRMDTLGGDIELLGGELDSMKISLFGMQAGPLRLLVQQLTRWFSANSDIIKQRLGEFIQGVADRLPQIVMWLRRILVAVVVFYSWWALLKVVTLATHLLGAALWVAGIALTAFRLATSLSSLGMVVFNTAMALMTVRTWAQMAAQGAYNAIVWLGTAAVFAYNAVVNQWVLLAAVLTAAIWVKNGAMVAYNAVLAIGTAIQTVNNVGGLVALARTVAMTAATWLLVAATAVLNAMLAAGPMFLLGAAILLLIGLVGHFTGLWSFLGKKIRQFGDWVMEKLGPVGTFLKALGAGIGEVVGGLGKIGDLTSGDNSFGFAGMGGDGSFSMVDNTPGAERVAPEPQFSMLDQPGWIPGPGEILIHDKTGRAEVVKSPGGFNMRSVPSSGGM